MKGRMTQSRGQMLGILPPLTSRNSPYLQTGSSLTSEFRGLCPSYVTSIFHTQEFLPWFPRTYLLLCVECTEITEALYLIAFLRDMKIWRTILKEIHLMWVVCCRTQGRWWNCSNWINDLITSSVLNEGKHRFYI